MDKKLLLGSWLILLCYLNTHPIYSNGQMLASFRTFEMGNSTIVAPPVRLTGVPPVEQTITGKVTLNIGEALPGVSLFKGTTNRAISDATGNYSISVPDNNAVLAFSCISFMTQEIPDGNRTIIYVQLLTDAKAISKLLVVSNGTQNKATLTGSVARVGGSGVFRGGTYEMWLGGNKVDLDTYKHSSDNLRSCYILRKFMPEDSPLNWQTTLLRHGPTSG